MICNSQYANNGSVPSISCLNKPRSIQITLIVISLISACLTCACFINGWSIPISGALLPAGSIPLFIFLAVSGTFLCIQIRKCLSQQEREEAWYGKLDTTINSRWFDFSQEQPKILQPGEPPGLKADRLPQIFDYEGTFKHFDPIKIALKLPRSRLDFFPREIRNQLEHFSQLDLYFLVYNPLIIGNNKRNLVFHTLAFPDADIGFDKCVELEMGIFKPSGIIVGTSEDDLQPNQWNSYPVYVHPKQVRKEDGTVESRQAISPNTASFYLDSLQDVSSFFSACILSEERAVATLSLFINTAEPEIHHLFDQIRDNTLRNFLEQVDQNLENQTVKEQIKQVFTS